MPTRYDQGLPVLASAPAYFRQNHYRSPTSSTTGPLQFANNTSLDTYAYWQTLPGVAENFNTFMDGHFAGKRLSWLEWFPAQQEIIDGFDKDVSPFLLIDVGGGRGHEVNALKTRFPGAEGKVVLEDLPDVIDDVRDIDDSIERIKYDFFEPQPIKGTVSCLSSVPSFSRIPSLRSIDRLVPPTQDLAPTSSPTSSTTGPTPKPSSSSATSPPP